LWAFLKGDEEVAGVPDGWKDDGKTLTAPNGISVVLGFRDFVIKNGWDAGNWPLTKEVTVELLEYGNPPIGGGNVQFFRKGALEYTKERGVFVMWSGQEILALRQKLFDQQSQMKDLQSQLLMSKHNDTIINDLRTRLNQIYNLSKI
jgi:hypothetical protein